MYKITDKRYLTENIYLMDIEAPRVARAAKPGQFIIIRNDKKDAINQEDSIYWFKGVHFVDKRSSSSSSAVAP